MLVAAYVIMITLSVLRGFGVLLGFARLAKGDGDAAEWALDVVVVAVFVFVAVAIGTVV